MSKEQPEPQPHLWDGTPMAAMPYVISKGNEEISMSEHTQGKLEADDGQSGFFGIFDKDGNPLAYLAESPPSCRWDRLPRDVGAAPSWEMTPSERCAMEYSRIEEHAASARRLVACWNACEGTPTDGVEAIAAIGGWSAAVDKTGDAVMAYIDRLSAINAELLEALKHLEHNASASGADMGLGLDAARVAIAKAQGEQHD